MTRFKKKLTKEEGKVLLHDLGCLYFGKQAITVDNRYHYELLKGNIMDLAGLTESDLRVEE